MKIWNLYMKQSGLSDVMHKLYCDLHFVSNFWLYVFILHCINSTLIILLMSICISVLLVWISIKMFKPWLTNYLFLAGEILMKQINKWMQNLFQKLAYYIKQICILYAYVSECGKWTWFWLSWTDLQLNFGLGTTLYQQAIITYDIPEPVPTFSAMGVTSGTGNSGAALWDFDVPQS